MKPNPTFKRLKYLPKKIVVFIISIPVAIIFFFLAYKVYLLDKTNKEQTSSLIAVVSDKNTVSEELKKKVEELEALKNQDQVKLNQELKKEVENIETTYKAAVTTCENLLQLKEITKDTKELDKLFTDILVTLSKRDYTTASTSIASLNTKIKEAEVKVTASVTIPANVPVQNAPPGSGYSRQQVTTDAGTFLVSIIAADLGSTKVIVDTASESDCTNDCPTLPLATYVSRSGAYAGVHGAYACPAEYPSCAGKTNSFDLLIMNKNKYYFNSANNVYSNNPAVIFGNGWIRFVRAASEWGRDTSVDGVLSNFPLLVFNGSITFNGNDDPKHTIRSGRGFVSNKGNTVYIGVVSNASVTESAKVLKAMDMENAINLDGGGSTALWHGGGYKLGPGRNLTNVILFLKK